ncbi:MAG: DUF4258 domain-containing protein [Chitinophagaceae bacterium]
MNNSLRKIIPYIVVGLLLVVLIVVKKCQSGNVKPPDPKTVKDNRDPSAEVDRNRGFDRRISYLKYSNHAKCRMECRHITQAEVEDVMKSGKINYNKSDLQNARCPRYAVEGLTKDNEDVRIIFAQCDESTTVVTVIDLDKDWSCDCPGDDKKYENKN